MPRVLPVNPAEPPASIVAEALAVLREGGIVALPTETFYGLAVDCRDRDALRRLNRLKGKPGAPILLLLGSVDQAEGIALELPPTFRTLAGRFWPGALTLVVTADRNLPEEVGGGKGTVGMRVPGLALPRRLASALGRPISGVSANLHGMPPSRTAADVVRSLPDGPELILDGGPSPGGAPSTIVDLTTEVPGLIREGLLPRAALERFIRFS